MNETELQVNFNNFLKNKKGYPSDSLLNDYKVGVLRIDLVIVNQPSELFLSKEKTKPENLALIEFKSSSDYDEMQVILQIKKYKNALGNLNMPSFLVVNSGKNSSLVLEVFILTNYGFQKIDPLDFPSIDELSFELNKR